MKKLVVVIMSLFLSLIVNAQDKKIKDVLTRSISNSNVLADNLKMDLRSRLEYRHGVCSKLIT